MTVLRIVLDNSVSFSLLFAGVWLVKALFGKHLSARLHYLVWMAVLASLLVPARIDSGITLWNLLPKQTAESIIVQTGYRQPQGDIGSGSKTQTNAGIEPHNQPAATSNAAANPVAPAPPEPVRAETAKPAKGIGLPAVLCAVWLAGAAIAGCWLVLGSLRLRRTIIRCSSPEVPPWLTACAMECGKALGQRRNVSIVLQPVLPVPSVMGVFRPMLAMPESVVKDGNKECVRHILMHELNHVRRGDLVVIAFMNLLSAVYWFNPLVWLCFGRIRVDMETSCDNDVVQLLGKSQRQDYIRTLVYFSAMGRRSRTQAALSLHDARVTMKKRIGAMFMTKKTKATIAVPVILLVFVLLIAASVTGCLPAAVSGTVLPSPSATAAAEPASPTATPANTAEPTATSAPTLKPQTSQPSPSATRAAATKAPAKTPKPAANGASEWEEKYQTVLDKYREFAKSQKNGTTDFSGWGDPWEQIAPDIAVASTKKFGYALRDMDGNGTPELFLMTSDGSIWAMYTYDSGKPKLLGTYWSRNSCSLDRSDIIYTCWSNGAADNGWDACRISKDGQGLELTLRVAIESTDEDGNMLDEPRYYKCVGSEKNKKIISKEQADAAMSKFPENNDDSGLKFLPLS